MSPQLVAHSSNIQRGKADEQTEVAEGFFQEGQQLSVVMLTIL